MLKDNSNTLGHTLVFTGVRISGLTGKNVTDARFIDMKTKSDIFMRNLVQLLSCNCNKKNIETSRSFIVVLDYHYISIALETRQWNPLFYFALMVLVCYSSRWSEY